jgi:hypothetical protein
MAVSGYKHKGIKRRASRCLARIDLWVFLCNLFHDIDCEFAYPVISAPITGLGNQGKCAVFPNSLFSWQPLRRNHPGSECAPIQKKLRPQILFAAVVSNKISDDGVATARQECVAPAEVVPGFVAAQGVACGANRIGDDEAPIATREPLAVSPHSSSPLRRGVTRLVDSRAEQTHDIWPRSVVRLPDIDIGPLLEGQRNERATGGNVGTNQAFGGEIFELDERALDLFYLRLSFWLFGGRIGFLRSAGRSQQQNHTR